MIRIAPLGEPAAPSAPTGPRPFFGRVEALRGLGALAVAGYHFSGAGLYCVSFLPEEPWEGVGDVQNGLRRVGLALLPAHAALMIFFVISGFVLRLSLAFGPQKVPVATAKFLLGRIFRIYPVVVFSLCLTLFLTGWQVCPLGEGPRPLSGREFLANLLLLDASMNNALWALQVELLMMPIILALYFLERSRGPHVLLGIALVCTLLSFTGRWAIWPPLSHNVFPFVLGMLVPTLGRDFAIGLSRRSAALWASGALVVLLLAAPCFGTYSRYTAIIEAYPAVLLVSLVAYRLDLGALRCLDWKLLRLLGLCSGSYYVLHVATMDTALTLGGLFIPPEWCVRVPLLVGLLAIPAWLAALVPLTVCSYYLVEAPGVALGRRVIRLCRLDSPRTAPPAGPTISRRAAA